jgi:hypothetical protein
MYPCSKLDFVGYGLGRYPVVNAEAKAECSDESSTEVTQTSIQELVQVMYNIDSPRLVQQIAAVNIYTTTRLWFCDKLS